jgi:hypothetical protein
MVLLTTASQAFIGSCMTNIGHFRSAAKLLGGSRDIPVKLWVATPTKMNESELIKEGHYANFGDAGAHTEMPGCSLCMGNQAQVREGATVVSTSTLNFPNRLGKNTNVFLASAELAAIASKLGHIPTVAEVHEAMVIVNKEGAAICPPNTEPHRGGCRATAHHTRTRVAAVGRVRSTGGQVGQVGAGADVEPDWVKRPKWPRTWMSISASVGEQWRQRFCQRCDARLRLAMLRRVVCRIVLVCGPSTMVRSGQAQRRSDLQVVQYFISCV